MKRWGYAPQPNGIDSRAAFSLGAYRLAYRDLYRELVRARATIGRLERRVESLEAIHRDYPGVDEPGRITATALRTLVES